MPVLATMNGRKMTREEFLLLQQNRLKNASINVAKSGYRLVLTPHFEQSANMTAEEHEMIDRLNEPIEFDLITEQSVSATSEITQYPTVSGDTIADHMKEFRKRSEVENAVNKGIS